MRSISPELVFPAGRTGWFDALDGTRGNLRETAMENIFFDNAFVLLRTTVIGILAYAALIALLRLSGKRTLSKMSAFDLVVTVALGSTLSSILLNKDITLAQGALAFALLIGLQFAITWSSVRVRSIRTAVTGEPSLLLYRGACLPDALLRARTTQDEIRMRGNAGDSTITRGGRARGSSRESARAAS